MIDWQNLVVRPCVSAFGQPATIVWNGQTFNLSTGVFDEAYKEVDVSDGMPVTTVNPTLGINTADVNLGGQPLSALQSARVTVYASAMPGGAPTMDTEYIVQEARADGHGFARLILNLVPTEQDEPADGGQDA
jgi:hypothetical protein